MNMSSSRTDGPVHPPVDADVLANLSLFLEQHTEPAVLLGPDGEQLPLPLEVYEILVRVVGAMRDGKSVAVEPLDRVLTTQQAADLLGISRPTLVKLLDAHEISYERPAPGRHRRLRLRDVVEYRDRRREDRRARMDEMTRQAVEDGLYDSSGDDYTEALRRARRSSED